MPNVKIYLIFLQNSSQICYDCFYINRSEYNLQIKLNNFYFKFISYEFRCISVLFYFHQGRFFLKGAIDLMTHWDIEVSKKMYNIITELFHISGIPIPSTITSIEMHKVLHKMKSIQYSNPKVDIERQTDMISDSVHEFKEIESALIISDVSLNSHQLKLTLQKNGIEVNLAENLYNGLALYIKKLPDLVVIDMSANEKEISKIIEEIEHIADKYKVHPSVMVVSHCSQAEKHFSKNQSKIFRKLVQKAGNWYSEIEDEIKGSSCMPI